MEELLRGNLEGIKSFDANKDGAIDEKELKVAAQTSLNWTDKSKEQHKNWYYYAKGKPFGPLLWEEIEQVKKDYPDMYVTFTEEGTTEKAKLWLPAKIIDEIRLKKA